MGIPVFTCEKYVCHRIALLVVFFCLKTEKQSGIILKTTDYAVVKHSNNSLYIKKNFSASLAGPDSMIIPLKRAGRLFFMEATIDEESGNLIFDTGATGLVLNRTYFRNHVHMDHKDSNGITGSVGGVDIVTVNEVKISDLSFKYVTAGLADLGHIENQRGIKVLGLFGFDKLKDFEIILDFAHNMLRLSHIDKRGDYIHPASQHFNPDYTQKIEVSKSILFVKGMIGGKMLRFCLDTGAETNAISIDAPKAVLNTITITRTSKLRGAGAISNEVLYGAMNDFMFGSALLPGMETIITNLDNLSEAYGTHIDGILGYDFLSKGMFCINFEKKQLGVRFIKAEEK
jgi:predicted aspartyl protease